MSDFVAKIWIVPLLQTNKKDSKNTPGDTTKKNNTSVKCVISNIQDLKASTSIFKTGHGDENVFKRNVSKKRL